MAGSDCEATPVPTPSSARYLSRDTLRARGQNGRWFDTVYVLDSAQEQHKIRLSGIDAPERNQAFGTKSKQHLTVFVAGEDVTLDWKKRDRWKRIIGKVIREDQDVNLAMVRAGYAWWYRKYAGEQPSQDRVLYEDAERKARSEEAGLWRDRDAVPPWEWRRR